MTPQIIIIDSDALIALFYRDDVHAQKAKQVFKILHVQKAKLIYPATTLVETIDTLQRKLKQHAEAIQIAHLIGGTQFARESVEPIDGDILQEAVKLFVASKSQRVTLADAVVAAVAKKYNADAIFSFDGWYKKQGFTLAIEMVNR